MGVPILAPSLTFLERLDDELFGGREMYELFRTGRTGNAWPLSDILGLDKVSSDLSLVVGHEVGIVDDMGESIPPHRTYHSRSVDEFLSQRQWWFNKTDVCTYPHIMRFDSWGHLAELLTSVGERRQLQQLAEVSERMHEHRTKVQRSTTRTWMAFFGNAIGT